MEAKVQQIVTTVRATQLSVVKHGIVIPPIPDSRWCNTDHIPFTIECVGNYSWGERNSGRRQIQTAGYEKQRFTAQLSILKNGTKLPVYFIFKGATPTTDGTEPRRNSLAYEFKHRLSDSNDNPYPPEDKAVLTCAPKANSNQFLTKDILEKVIFPAIGINEGLRGGVLVDDFKAHSASVVKDFTTEKEKWQ